MWRSSQPKSGVSGACTADEKLLDLIAQSCVYKRTPLGGLKIVGDPLLCIVDCRPKVSFNVESYHLLPCLPFFYSKFWPHLNLRDQEYQLTQVLHLTVYFLPLLIILICLVKDSILHAALLSLISTPQPNYDTCCPTDRVYILLLHSRQALLRTKLLVQDMNHRAIIRIPRSILIILEISML